MSRKKNKPLRPPPPPHQLPAASPPNCCEGDRLDHLLHLLRRSVDSARRLSKGQLPDKIWFKQQFAIGVNDVTRVLERMPPSTVGAQPADGRALPRAPLVPLQAVILAHDCSPRWLTKHVPSLASSRQVPVIVVKNNKGASLRLGALVNLRTAMAIGVKARENEINEAINTFMSEGAAEVITNGVVAQ